MDSLDLVFVEVERDRESCGRFEGLLQTVQEVAVECAVGTPGGRSQQQQKHAQKKQRVGGPSLFSSRQKSNTSVDSADLLVEDAPEEFVPFPAELKNLHLAAQTTSYSGLLPEISCMWLTADTWFYLWNYGIEDQDEVNVVRQELSGLVLSVSLSAPKQSVLDAREELLDGAQTAPYMLVVSSTLGVHLFHLCKIHSALCPPKYALLSPKHDLFFPTPSSNPMLLVRGSQSGYIFCVSAEGHLSSLDYDLVDEGNKNWIPQVLQVRRKVPRTTILKHTPVSGGGHSPGLGASGGPLANLAGLAKGLLFSSGDEDTSPALLHGKVVDLAVDNARHTVFVLFARGALGILHFGSEGHRSYEVSTSSARYALVDLYSTLRGSAGQFEGFLPSSLSSGGGVGGSLSSAIPQPVRVIPMLPCESSGPSSIRELDAIVVLSNGARVGLRCPQKQGGAFVCGLLPASSAWTQHATGLGRARGAEGVPLAYACGEFLSAEGGDLIASVGTSESRLSLSSGEITDIQADNPFRDRANNVQDGRGGNFLQEIIEGRLVAAAFKTPTRSTPHLPLLPAGAAIRTAGRPTTVPLLPAQALRQSPLGPSVSFVVSTRLGVHRRLLVRVAPALRGGGAGGWDAWRWAGAGAGGNVGTEAEKQSDAEGVCFLLSAACELRDDGALLRRALESGSVDVHGLRVQSPRSLSDVVHGAAKCLARILLPLWDEGFLCDQPQGQDDNAQLAWSSCYDNNALACQPVLDMLAAFYDQLGYLSSSQAIADKSTKDQLQGLRTIASNAMQALQLIRESTYVYFNAREHSQAGAGHHAKGRWEAYLRFANTETLGKLDKETLQRVLRHPGVLRSFLHATSRAIIAGNASYRRKDASDEEDHTPHSQATGFAAELDEAQTELGLPAAAMGAYWGLADLREVDAVSQLKVLLQSPDDGEGNDRLVEVLSSHFDAIQGWHWDEGKRDVVMCDPELSFGQDLLSALSELAGLDGGHNAAKIHRTMIDVTCQVFSAPRMRDRLDPCKPEFRPDIANSIVTQLLDTLPGPEDPQLQDLLEFALGRFNQLGHPRDTALPLCALLDYYLRESERAGLRVSSAAGDHDGHVQSHAQMLLKAPLLCHELYEGPLCLKQRLLSGAQQEVKWQHHILCTAHHVLLALAKSRDNRVLKTLRAARRTYIEESLRLLEANTLGEIDPAVGFSSLHVERLELAMHAASCLLVCGGDYDTALKRCRWSHLARVQLDLREYLISEGAGVGPCAAPRDRLVRALGARVMSDWFEPGSVASLLEGCELQRASEFLLRAVEVTEAAVLPDADINVVLVSAGVDSAQTSPSRHSREDRRRLWQAVISDGQAQEGPGPGAILSDIVSVQRWLAQPLPEDWLDLQGGGFTKPRGLPPSSSTGLALYFLQLCLTAGEGQISPVEVVQSLVRRSDGAAAAAQLGFSAAADPVQLYLLAQDNYHAPTNLLIACMSVLTSIHQAMNKARPLGLLLQAPLNSAQVSEE